MNTEPKNIFRILINYWDKFEVWGLRYFYYRFILKFYSIQYKSLPIIRGKMKISNYGKCEFGKHIVFNSSFRSNSMGLNKHCTIFVQESGKLYIDDNSGFSGVSIYCINEINIGKNLNCGGNVSIWDTDFHPLDYMERRANLKTFKTAPIKIGNDVFIGANSIILKGVTIGDRCIIGAGSVVTKNILCDQLWAGNPACFIKNI